MNSKVSYAICLRPDKRRKLIHSLLGDPSGVKVDQCNKEYRVVDEISLSAFLPSIYPTRGDARIASISLLPLHPLVLSGLHYINVLSS